MAAAWRIGGRARTINEARRFVRRTSGAAPHEGQPRFRSGASPGRRADAGEDDALATREWLVTNGLGGYASGTISGVITRRYHGYLIAALPAPLGRMVMLSHIAVQVRYPDGRRIEVGGREQLQPVTDRGRRLPDRVPSGSGPAGLALRHQRPHPRNAPLPHAHAEHGARDVRAPRRRRAAWSSGCGPRSTSVRRRRRSASRSAGRTSSAPSTIATRSR